MTFDLARILVVEDKCVVRQPRAHRNPLIQHRKAIFMSADASAQVTDAVVRHCHRSAFVR